MPSDWEDFEQTTCRHPYCPATDRSSQPRSYRISVERSTNFEEDSVFSHTIPLQPQFPWGPGLKSGRYAAPKRGLGKDVLSWWCLSCIEQVWLEGEGFIKFRYQYKRTDEPELWELLRNVTPETRTGGPKDRLYHLSPMQRDAIEAWRVAKDYEWECQYGAGPSELTHPPEPAIILTDDETTGERVVVALHELAPQTLSEALETVDDNVERARRQVSDSTSTTGPSGEVTEAGASADYTLGSAIEPATSTEPCSHPQLLVKLKVSTDFLRNLATPQLIVKLKLGGGALEKLGRPRLMVKLKVKVDAPMEPARSQDRIVSARLESNSRTMTGRKRRVSDLSSPESDANEPSYEDIHRPKRTEV